MRPMDELLKVDVQSQPGMAIATIEGEARLLVKSLETACLKLAAGHPKVVVLDMTNLTIISSLGMGLIVSLRNTLKRHGVRLFAVGVRPPVLDSFRRAKLEGVFEVAESIEAAV